MATRRPRQLSFHDLRMRTGRGGPRPGAGRPRVYRDPPVHHVARGPLPKGRPVHVSLRVRDDVPNLRTTAFLAELRRTLAEACERGDFRVVHYAVLRTHAHLIVEAAGADALGRGMRSIASRFAKAVNRVYDRRGPVLFGRYWLRVLSSPREVRNALRYVLLNSRHHMREASESNARVPRQVRLDAGTSGRWFDGWSRPMPAPAGPAPLEREVAEPRTWLLSVGWRRHGPIDPDDVPG